MVLTSAPVFTGYIVDIVFLFFYKEKKILRKHNWACSLCFFFFFLITILSILLPIFSDFFLSSKDFLLNYSTLKFHLSPSNNVPFSSQSLSSQHLTLLPRHFFHPVTCALSHNHNWVGFCHPWNSDSVGYLIHLPILTVFGNQILYPGGLTSLLLNVFSQSLDVMEIFSARWERCCCFIIFKVLSHLQSVLLPNTFSPPVLCSGSF